MIRDGIKDAPELRYYNTGVAIEKRVTCVAWDYSENILVDNRFFTIVVSVKKGCMERDKPPSILLFNTSTNNYQSFSVTIGIVLDIKVIPLIQPRYYNSTLYIILPFDFYFLSNLLSIASFITLSPSPNISTEPRRIQLGWIICWEGHFQQGWCF